MRRSILFLCVANSARSQMAEGLARAHFGPEIRVQSAGSSPTRVNPFALRAMAEQHIDISAQRSTSVVDIDPSSVDLVITLCAEEVCPRVFSSIPHLHWPLPDPDRKDEVLSDAERMTHFRQTRDALQERIEALDI